MFSKMLLAKAKQYSVAGVLFAGIWMGSSLNARAVLMAYDWPAFHAVMIEMLMFIQFISCVWVVLKCRAAIPAILLLIGVWQAPILIDVLSGYRAAVDLFGAKFLLVVLLILPILITCLAKGGDAMPKEGDHVEAGVVSQISQQVMTFPAQGERYTRGFLTGRPRVFSLFIAHT